MGIDRASHLRIVFKVQTGSVVDSAIATGVTDRLWNLADLVAAWEASERRLERAA